MGCLQRGWEGEEPCPWRPLRVLHTERRRAMTRNRNSCGVGLGRPAGNDHGIALVTALMFLAVLALLGATTATLTTVASQASGNYKATIQSFQVAEAGAEEARG